MLERFFRRIEEKRTDNSLAPALVVALGDSVTQGCMQAGVFDFKHVYHNVLKGLLETEFLGTTFNMLNAGVGGESAAGGLKRVQRDLVRHDPDLSLVAFCLNDSCGGREKLQDYRDNIKRLFDAIRSGCASDIVAVTPNFMASRPTRRIAEVHKRYTETITRTQTDGTLKAYVEALRECASSYGVPVADVYAKWERMASEGVDTTAMLVNGLNHPDVKRQRLVAQTILETILSSRRSST
jgi:acyl-CoA thioesterase I